MTISFQWNAKKLPDTPTKLYWELVGSNSSTNTERSAFGYVTLETAPAEDADLGDLAKTALGEQAATEESLMSAALTPYSEPTPPPYI